MYILKNAWTTICRNKGRNILIGIIVLVISMASAVTLSIRNSASKIINAYKDSTDITATIGMDRQSLMGSGKPDDSTSIDDKKEIFNNIEQLTIQDVESYGDSDYIKSYYYTYSLSMNSSNVEKASSDINVPDNDKGRGFSESADFKIVGYSSYDAMTDFISGTYKITDGEVNSDFESNTCVINEELATANNLNIGDTIILSDPNDDNITYELEITGVFSDSDNSSDNMMSMFSSSVNTIITNSNVVSNISALDSSLKTQVSPTFILENANIVEELEEELTDKGMSEYYTLTTNLDSIDSQTKAISNLSSYATTFLIIILIVGSIILLVVNMINVRERKYEIGVLRTMGMNKKTVISQFVLELLIVSIISLLLGTGIGAIVSIPTANKLLESEINSSTLEQEQISENFGRGEMGAIPNDIGKMNMNNMGVTKVEQITEINAVVNFKVLLELLGIGILLTVISSVASVLNISRFSPLTILKERS